MEYAIGFIGFLLTIISSYIGIKIKGVDQESKIISKNVAEINGSIRELKVWSTMHEKQDDRRFNDLSVLVKE